VSQSTIASMSAPTAQPFVASTNPAGPLRRVAAGLETHRLQAKTHLGAAAGGEAPASGADVAPDLLTDDAAALSQTLAVVLQPEFQTALDAPASPWFAAARRVAAAEHLSAQAVTSLFDASLLAAFGHSRSQPWFAFALRSLSAAAGHSTHLIDNITEANVASRCADPATDRPLTVPTQDDPPAPMPREAAAPPAAPPEAAPASPKPCVEAPAPAERMLRLLPEVRHSPTATSPEGIIDAVFAHLIGRAA